MQLKERKGIFWLKSYSLIPPPGANTFKEKESLFGFANIRIVNIFIARSGFDLKCKHYQFWTFFHDRIFRIFWLYKKLHWPKSYAILKATYLNSKNWHLFNIASYSLVVSSLTKTKARAVGRYVVPSQGSPLSCPLSQCLWRTCYRLELWANLFKRIDLMKGNFSRKAILETLEKVKLCLLAIEVFERNYFWKIYYKLNFGNSYSYRKLSWWFLLNSIETKPNTLFYDVCTPLF